ncbi:hypothetical protein [Glycomyces paridis]|uniref:Uncharacterized protein n=1 Tax=Glycomyces paridis TaxID=2126555 RepID=A0A4S8PFC0_9ACTN|nr:hypothetical protein [Glycomyces paridis]THV29100.1 hypothetical protein E9998_10180 [Glycomyces paridis]
MRPPQPWPGDPAAVWAATAAPDDAPERPAPPDLSSFADFERLAAPKDSSRAGAVVLAVSGVLFLAYGLILMAVMPGPVEGVEGFFAAVIFVVRWHWIAPLAAGAWFLASAPIAYRRDKRDHPGETRDLYEAARERGVVVETFPARFRVLDTEGTAPATIGVDVRLDAADAARIRRAFDAWFDRLDAEPKAVDRAQRRNGEREVRPAEDLFGTEAAGGYLMRRTHWGQRFTLLVPDPPHSTRRWARLPIEHGSDVSDES